MIWVFARFDGRISRQVYWLANAALIAVMAVVMRPEIDPATGAVSMHLGNAGFILVFLAVASGLAIGAKRLHDFNISALFAVALVVPALSILATLIIGLVPGTPSANRYGRAADQVP